MFSALALSWRSSGVTSRIRRRLGRAAYFTCTRRWAKNQVIGASLYTSTVGSSIRDVYRVAVPEAATQTVQICMRSY